jgi:hypothetical protein
MESVIGFVFFFGVGEGSVGVWMRRVYVIMYVCIRYNPPTPKKPNPTNNNTPQTRCTGARATGGGGQARAGRGRRLLTS